MALRGQKGWAIMKHVFYKSLVNSAFAVVTLLPLIASAWVEAVAERAAQRAAIQAVERSAAKQASKTAAQTASRRALTQTGDRIVNRWASSLCKPSNPCPLPAKTANTFVGGAYDEVILSNDTVLYRVYHEPKFKFGATGEASYWSRSDASGTQAVIDRAIPVSKNGNTADRLVAINVPKGTRIFEGKAQALERGPIGGGGQVVIDDVKPEWEIKSTIQQ